jgi:hypothetical protein
MSNRVLLYLFFFLSFGLDAQQGYISGYVITNKGDTLKGLIKDRKYVSGISSWQKVKFIDVAGGHFIYTPDDIKEYKRNGRTRYVTQVIGVEARNTFLEVSEEGPVLLLSYYRGTWGGAGNAITLGGKKKEKSERTAFYASIGGFPVYNVNDQGSKVECFLRFNNKPASLMEWRPRDYKTTAKVFFGDNQEIIKLLEDNILDEDDIYAIVKKYNRSKTGK